MRLRKRQLTVGEMTVPLIGCSLLNAFVGLADTWIAGGISPDAQAAVAIGEQLLYIAISIVTGLTIAVSTVISQAIGARKLALARAYARDGLLLAATFGLSAVVVGTTFPSQLYSCLGVPPEVARLGSRYLYICSFGNLPFSIMLMLSAVLRSFGRPFPALTMTALCSVVSVGGAFMLTRAPFQIGVDALGLSWLVGSIGATLLGFVLFRRHLKQCSILTPSLNLLWRLRALFSLAVPAAGSEIVYGIAMVLFFREILQASGGLAAQAGYAACAKIEETFAAMPMQAVSQAIACVVGRMFGAKNYGAAITTARRAALLSAGAMIVTGGITAALAPTLGHSFSATGDTQFAIEIFLLFSPVLYVMLGVSMSVGGALDGVGRCARVSTIYCGSAALVRFPLSVLLLYFGMAAIPLTVTSLLVSRGIAALVMVNDLRKGICSTEVQLY